MLTYSTGAIATCRPDHEDQGSTGHIEELNVSTIQDGTSLDWLN